jgi:hypothetical protein
MSNQQMSTLSHGKFDFLGILMHGFIDEIQWVIGHDFDPISQT